jgi:hypothetical protein
MEDRMRRVLAGLCGVTLLATAACGVPGGVEVEGHASQVSPPPSTTTTPSGTPPSADPVAVLRDDETLDPKIRQSLVPCADGYYPIDDRYVDLTGDGVAELVMTLYSCPEVDEKAAAESGATGGLYVSGGYAGFVYDLVTKPPTRLLGVQDNSVEFVPSQKGEPGLILIRNRWGENDRPCCPTDQSVVLYKWDGTKFIEVEPK